MDINSLTSKFFEKYQNLILKKPIPSLLVIGVIVGFFFAHLPQFELDASADSLILENDSSLKFYRKMRELGLILLVHTGDEHAVDAADFQHLGNLCQPVAGAHLRERFFGPDENEGQSVQAKRRRRQARHRNRTGQLFCTMARSLGFICNRAIL